MNGKDESRESPQDGVSPVVNPDDWSWEPVSAVVADEQPPLRWREIVAIVLLVVVCDLTIYRGHGFAGYAVLFIVAPALLAIGSPRPRFGAIFWIIGAMMAILAVKLLWCGSMLLVAAGFALLVAFAAVLSGMYPYVLEVGVFASQTILAGYGGLRHYERGLYKLAPVAVVRSRWLSVALPLAAFVVFSLLFVLANPDLLAFCGERMRLALDVIRQWMLRFSPSAWEFVFWVAVLWMSVGLLRPAVGRSLFSGRSDEATAAVDGVDASAPSPLYAAFRNTLLTVIVLFAVYLIFEFKTLWFRVFPEGFYYSGYAHEGAAWLTVALALATAILSLVFQGRILQDPRLPTLRKLAWIWSLENILLAASVYHRLSIYIGFNGMTRMRMVAIFGMSAVVVGFILVVWKITCNRDFLWLMRRHLWTLALTVYVFALTPVDAIVTEYNVRRILSGDPSPSVQISVHPIGPEGVVLLEPLLGSDDPIIREGVRAMLAQRCEEAEALARRHREQGWTTYQIADEFVLKKLRIASDNWADYATDPNRRNAALQHFHDYTYQWY